MSFKSLIAKSVALTQQKQNVKLVFKNKHLTGTAEEPESTVFGKNIAHPWPELQSRYLALRLKGAMSRRFCCFWSILR